MSNLLAAFERINAVCLLTSCPSRARHVVGATFNTSFPVPFFHIAKSNRQQSLYLRLSHMILALYENPHIGRMAHLLQQRVTLNS
jgi:hypothetical protein